MKKRTVIAGSLILLGVVLLIGSTASQAAWRLEKKLNPQGQKWWVTISDRETMKFFPMKEYRLSRRGYGFSLIGAAEGYIQSGSPAITAFSPDQIVLEEIDPKYHYLLVLPTSEIEKILAEDKCVIASQKVKLSVRRQILDNKGKWVTTSETEGETYVTLIAAPSKNSLGKAINRFFSLREIPLEPIIFTAK